MKKIAVFLSAFLSANIAFAQSSNDNSTTSTSTGQAQAVNTPVQQIISNGSRVVGNAPSMAVGGSIGSHVCEASAGISGGWFSGAAGTVFTYARESCVFLNVGDFMQQSATMEEKSGRPAVATELRDASYELMAEIDPKVRAVLSRQHLLKGQAAVQSDQSGTVGLQPQNYRVGG